MKYIYVLFVILIFNNVSSGQSYLPLQDFLKVFRRDGGQNYHTLDTTNYINCYFIAHKEYSKVSWHDYKSNDFEIIKKKIFTLLDKSIKLNPSFTFAYYKKAIIYRNQDFLSESLIELNKSIKIDSNFYFALKLKSEIYNILLNKDSSLYFQKKANLCKLEYNKRYQKFKDSLSEVLYVKIQLPLSLNSFTKGGYMNFEEVIYNQPSLNCNCKIAEIDTLKHRYYKEFIPYNIQCGSDSLNRYLYAYSDGNLIFVNSQKFSKKRIDINPKYYEFKHIGRYIVFSIVEEIIRDSYPTDKIPKKRTKIININNEFICDLNKRKLKMILSSDLELYNEFKHLKSKKNHLVEYVIKYSEKHKDEIRQPKKVNLDNLFERIF